MLVVFCILWLLLSPISLALLGEQIVAFRPQNGTVNIHDAAVVYAADDPVGIEIAAKSLTEDLEQITGKRPKRFAVHVRNGTGSQIFGGQAPQTAIIAATLNSTLMQSLSNTGHANITEIQGKWETFKTFIVHKPLSGGICLSRISLFLS